jgi:AraC family transcriptional regulator
MRPSGGWISIVHHAAYTEHHIDLEVAIPVELPLPAGRRGADRKPVKRLAGLSKAACVVHAGPAEDLGQAYAALFNWVQANPWRQAGAIREVCHADPLDGPEPCPLVELQMPVEPLTLPQLNPSTDSAHQERPMEIKLIEKPAFMAVGMKYLGKNENGEIGQMWGRFNQVAGAIAQDVKGCYGVCSMLEGVDDGTFEYLACFELEKADKLPDWAVVKMLPANTYAVFEHIGAAEGLRGTYQKIYTTWLPQSGYEPMGGYDMEVYTDEFKDFAPDSKMYIYVPVKKK